MIRLLIRNYHDPGTLRNFERGGGKGGLIFPFTKTVECFTRYESRTPYLKQDSEANK